MGRFGGRVVVDCRSGDHFGAGLLVLRQADGQQRKLHRLFHPRVVERIGEVTIPIPESGFGEVMIKLGAGNTLHIASSFDRCLLAAGTRVVVVDVFDGVLRVAKLDERKGDVV